MKITTIGLDITKSTFHTVCCNAQGSVVKKNAQALTSVNLFSFTTRVPGCPESLCHLALLGKGHPAMWSCRQTDTASTCQSLSDR